VCSVHSPIKTLHPPEGTPSCTRSSFLAHKGPHLACSTQSHQGLVLPACIFCCSQKLPRHTKTHAMGVPPRVLMRPCPLCLWCLGPETPDPCTLHRDSTTGTPMWCIWCMDPESNPSETTVIRTISTATRERKPLELTGAAAVHKPHLRDYSRVHPCWELCPCTFHHTALVRHPSRHLTKYCTKFKMIACK
jgi:hypothetical protein